MEMNEIVKLAIDGRYDEVLDELEKLPPRSIGEFIETFQKDKKDFVDDFICTYQRNKKKDLIG